MNTPRRHPSPRPAETVLVVDDEEVVCEIVAATLREGGYHTIQALSPELGLVALTDEPSPIHLLMTDVSLPGMNGRELARRGTLIRPELRVLFMSGYADNASTLEGFPAPGSDFLQKPFPPDLLYRAVRAVLDRVRV